MAIDYTIQYRQFHDDSEAHACGMAAYYWSLIENFVLPDKGAKILDIGCGFGFALRALRNAGYLNISGLEVSAEQGKVAKLAGFDVEVVENTMDWLQARSNQFDFVLLLDVLEHIPVKSQISLLQAVRASLTSRGRIVVQVPNADSLLAMRWRYDDFTHYSSFTERSLRFALLNAGFTQIEISVDKGVGRFPRRLWRHSDRVALRKWVVRWVWLQVYKAEIPWERLEQISFNLNLFAAARV